MNAEAMIEHIRHLSETIGPRPAGSPAEEQARAYICERLTGWGYTPERQPAAFAPLPRLLPFGLLVWLALVTGGWLVGDFPWVGLALPLLIPLLPQISRWLLNMRPRKNHSENVITYAPAPAALRLTLLLCAHVDSARAVPLHGVWLRLHGYTLDIAQRAALAAGALAVAQFLGLLVPPILIIAIGGLATLAGLWFAVDDLWIQLAHRGRYSPGANDNASGVALLLAAAEHFAAQPPQNIRLGFLFTTAEETGMHGAEAFAAGLAGREKPARPPAPRRGRGNENVPPPPPLSGTVVINLDMVGAGDTLRLVTHEGVYLPLVTDDRLNDLIRQAHPAVSEIGYTIKSGDFTAFLRRGFPAASLQTTGNATAELAYHTVDDKADVIDLAALEMTLSAVIGVVNRAGNEN